MQHMHIPQPCSVCTHTILLRTAIMLQTNKNICTFAAGPAMRGARSNASTSTLASKILLAWKGSSTLLIKNGCFKWYVIVICQCIWLKLDWAQIYLFISVKQQWIVFLHWSCRIFTSFPSSNQIIWAITKLSGFYDGCHYDLLSAHFEARMAASSASADYTTDYQRSHLEKGQWDWPWTSPYWQKPAVYKSLVQTLQEATKGSSVLFNMQRSSSKGNAVFHLFGLILFQWLIWF